MTEAKAPDQYADMQLTLNVVLSESHPSLRKHPGVLTHQIGEALLRELDEPEERRAFAERLELPADASFRLVVHAVGADDNAATTS